MPRILLIGDHPDLRQGLEQSGALADCEIVTAAGNVDAVHHVRARATDVVLTDPDTPIQDDLALVNELRVSRPGLKAIVLAPAAAPGSSSRRFAPTSLRASSRRSTSPPSPTCRSAPLMPSSGATASAWNRACPTGSR